MAGKQMKWKDKDIKKKQYTAVTILKGHNSNSIQTFMGIVYIA